MPPNEHTELARSIIKNNIYLSLGTSDGNPWVAPVYYCIDDQYNFYFISQPNSLHIRQLLKNPQVAFAIFDSHQQEGAGNGVQGMGIAHVLEDEQLKQALQWYKTSLIESKVESFTAPAAYRLFKIVPQKIYVLDPNSKVDKRTHVNLLR